MDTLQKGDKVEINTNDGKAMFISFQSYLHRSYVTWNNINILLSEFEEELNHLDKGPLSDHPSSSTLCTFVLTVWFDQKCNMIQLLPGDIEWSSLLPGEQAAK